MPGHAILVPEGPEKSQEKCSGGNQVARGAPEELPRCWGFTGKAGDLQAANHHSRCGAAKNSEEAEVLDVDEGEGGKADNRAQLAESELAAQRAKEGEEAAVGEGQASSVN